PEYPCLLRSLTGIIPRVDEVFGKDSAEPGAHVTLEVVAARGEYRPGQDEPEYADERGPRCYDYPAGTRPQYPPDGPIQDGSTAPVAGAPPGAGGSGGLGLANSPQERAAVSTVLAPSMGTPARAVPQWSSVLVGPVLRGAEVSYR
ncbi:MCE family protein, partial [Saccharopolyspora sp. MS10]|uniref:MCE family protein n=1 Tax=Saccharopolyspora sp. MS10 TaxID=3385973 RepID=UPI00399F8575